MVGDRCIVDNSGGGYDLSRSMHHVEYYLVRLKVQMRREEEIVREEESHLYTADVVITGSHQLKQRLAEESWVSVPKLNRPVEGGGEE